jgi:hypothetical protein
MKPTNLALLVEKINDLLRDIPEASLRSTNLESQSHALRTWSYAVSELLTQSDMELHLAYVPPFPLTGLELLAFGESIERVIQARAAVNLRHTLGSVSHTRSSLRRLMRSSLILGALITLSALSLSLAMVTLIYHRAALNGWPAYLLMAGMVSSWVALLNWIWSQRSLGRHRRALKFAGHASPFSFS